jgi:hypothetical protein
MRRVKLEEAIILTSNIVGYINDKKGVQVPIKPVKKESTFSRPQLKRPSRDNLKMRNTSIVIEKSNMLKKCIDTFKRKPSISENPDLMKELEEVFKNEYSGRAKSIERPSLPNIEDLKSTEEDEVTTSPFMSYPGLTSYNDLSSPEKTQQLEDFIDRDTINSRVRGLVREKITLVTNNNTCIRRLTGEIVLDLKLGFNIGHKTFIITVDKDTWKDYPRYSITPMCDHNNLSNDFSNIRVTCKDLKDHEYKVLSYHTEDDNMNLLPVDFIIKKEFFMNKVKIEIYPRIFFHGSQEIIIEVPMTHHAKVMHCSYPDYKYKGNMIFMSMQSLNNVSLLIDTNDFRIVNNVRIKNVITRSCKKVTVSYIDENLVLNHLDVIENIEIERIHEFN